MTAIQFGVFICSCIGIGCGQGYSPPVSLAARNPGNGVSIVLEDDSFAFGERIDFKLRMDLEGFDGLVCPCVDSTLVWPVLKRDDEVVRSIPFRSDVGEPETNRVIEVDPRRYCCVDATPASQIATLSFLVPLNYDDPTNMAFMVFEIPPGKYKLRVYYRFNPIANDCWGACRSEYSSVSDEPKVFGADCEMESNEVSFVVRCPPYRPHPD